MGARSQSASGAGPCALSIFGHLIGLIMQININFISDFRLSV